MKSIVQPLIKVTITIVMVLALLFFHACRKDDQYFPDRLKPDNQILPDTLASSLLSKVSDDRRLADTQEAVVNNKYDTKTLESDSQEIVVCGLIIQVFHKEDIVRLEQRFTSIQLQMIKNLFGDTIFLFEVDLPSDADMDMILDQIRNDEYTIQAEWNKTLKKR